MNFRSRSTGNRLIDAAIDVTPLVDMVFQLIIFLLISTTFKQKEFAFTLNLPTATEQEVVIEAERSTVYITTKGEYFYLEVAPEARPGGPPKPATPAMSLTELETRLRDLVQRDPRVALSVKAEESARYQCIINVVNLCYKVGLQRVYFPYQPVDGQPVAAPPPAGPAAAAPAPAGPAAGSAP